MVIVFFRPIFKNNNEKINWDNLVKVFAKTYWTRVQFPSSPQK